MNRRALTVGFTLLISTLCLLAQSGIAHAQAQTVRVRVTTTIGLINAILSANSSAVATQINVAPGKYQFTQLFDSEFGVSYLPPIEGDIWIIGRDAATTELMQGPYPTPRARMFTILSGARLIILRMTISGGIADDERPDFPYGGGAVANYGGFLRLDDCVISANAAGPDAAGGAILIVNGRLQLENTVVTGNGATSIGGGLAMYGGKGLIRHSIISNNGVDTCGVGGCGAAGGGIYVGAGILRIYNSTISSNRVIALDPGDITEGGGIHNSGTVLLADSAVFGNTTNRPDVFGAGSGGGIFNSGNLTIRNTTIGGNTANTSGGGLFNRVGTVVLEGATIAGNHSLGLVNGPSDGSYPAGCDPVTAPTLCTTGGGGIWNEPSARVRTARTVITGNTLAHPEEFGGTIGPDCAGALISDGRNAVAAATGCTLRPSATLGGANPKDLVNLDVRLGAFRDDGTPGNGHFPLRRTSPLIDRGGTIGTHCTVADQIGQSRVDGDADGAVSCDIGAIEFHH